MRANDNEKCQEFPLTEVKKQRYYARPTIKKDVFIERKITATETITDEQGRKIHGEAQLLKQISFLAEKNRKQGRYCFVYSTNSPCSAESTYDTSCTNKIFDE